MTGDSVVFPPIMRGVRDNRKSSITDNYNKYQQSKDAEKKQKVRIRRGESKSDSELRKLKKENARLQEELSMTQQTPREEVTCKGEIVDARKRVVQLRLTYNEHVSRRMLKDKQLAKMDNKVQTINMELGEGEGDSPSPSSKGGHSPASSMQSLSKMTETVQEEHERLKNLLQDTDKSMIDLECFQIMLQFKMRQYMSTQSGMESQYKSLRKELNILDRQIHEIELKIRTLEHGELAAAAKAQDIVGDIKKYEKQREELKAQQRQKKEKQGRIQEYMQSRELNRQNLKKEMNGDAWDSSMQNDDTDHGGDGGAMVVDMMFEKFMERLIERIGIGDNLLFVLQKLENMNDTQEEVQNRKVETEIKLQALEKERAQLQQQLQEIAVNGTDFSFRRHEIDEIEERTHTKSKKLRHLMGSMDSVARMVSSAQIGIDSILTKLDYLKVRAPADQQKVEAGKPDKSGVQAMMGMQSSLAGAGQDKGEQDKNTEEHEDPLLRQLDLVEQKLSKIVDSLASAHMNRGGGDAHHDGAHGESEGGQAMNWLSSDLQKMNMDMPHQGQYNLRVNLTTPTAALPSAPSSAGAFDAEALSDDSMELPEMRPVKNHRHQAVLASGGVGSVGVGGGMGMGGAGAPGGPGGAVKSAASQSAAAPAKRRNKSKSAILPPSKPKPSRAKQGSMYVRGN